MKTTTILAGLFATAIAAIEGRAKHNATAECAERFERDDALKTAVLEYDATVADMCAGATGEVSGADAGFSDTIAGSSDTIAGSSDTLAGSSDTGSSVAKLDTPHNPPTLDEMLRYIGCGDCRDKFNKCMNVSLSLLLLHVSGMVGPIGTAVPTASVVPTATVVARTMLTPCSSGRAGSSPRRAPSLASAMSSARTLSARAVGSSARRGDGDSLHFVGPWCWGKGWVQDRCVKDIVEMENYT
jgi:hypothetical protein